MATRPIRLLAVSLVVILFIPSLVSAIHTTQNGVTIQADNEYATCNGKTCYFDVTFSNEELVGTKILSTAPFSQNGLEVVSLQKWEKNISHLQQLRFPYYIPFDCSFTDEQNVTINQICSQELWNETTTQVYYDDWQEVSLNTILDYDLSFQYNIGYCENFKIIGSEQNPKYKCLDTTKYHKIKRSSVFQLTPLEQAKYRFTFKVPLMSFYKFDINLYGNNVTILDPFINNTYFQESFADTTDINTTTTTANISSGKAFLTPAHALANQLYANYEFNNSLVDSIGRYNLTAIGTNTFYALDKNSATNQSINITQTTNSTSNITFASMSGWKNVTMTSWVKVQSSTSGARTVVAVQNGSAGVLKINVATGDQPECYFAVGGATSTSIQSSTTIDDGNWHLIVCTMNATNMSMSLDGGAFTVTSLPNSNGISYGSGYELRMGYTGTNYWAGLIADVKIYNRTFVIGDVTALNNSGTQLYYPANINPAVTSAVAYSKNITATTNIVSVNWSINDSGTGCTYGYSEDGTTYQTATNNTIYNYTTTSNKFYWNSSLATGCEIYDLNFYFTNNSAPNLKANVSNYTWSFINTLVLNLTDYFNDTQNNIIGYQKYNKTSCTFLWSMNNATAQFNITGATDTAESCVYVFGAYDGEFWTNSTNFTLTMTKWNVAPTLIANISNHSYNYGSNVLLNMTDYFNDSNSNIIGYQEYNLSSCTMNFSVNNASNQINITATIDADANCTMIIGAYDGEFWTNSSNFTISVVGTIIAGGGGASGGGSFDFSVPINDTCSIDQKFYDFAYSMSSVDLEELFDCVIITFQEGINNSISARSVDTTSYSYQTSDKKIVTWDVVTKDFEELGKGNLSGIVVFLQDLITYSLGTTSGSMVS